MPRICENCRYYSPDDVAAACPECSAPLRATLLPPPAAYTLAGERPPRPAVVTAGNHNRQPVFELSATSPLGLVALGLIAFVLFGALWEWAKNDPTGESDSTGRIRVGMRMSDVARVIEPEARTAGIPHLTDDFPPGNTRSGDLEWREDGRWVRVTFAGGVVTGVREEPAGLSGFGNTGRRVQMRMD